MNRMARPATYEILNAEGRVLGRQVLRDRRRRSSIPVDLSGVATHVRMRLPDGTTVTVAIAPPKEPAQDHPGG